MKVALVNPPFANYRRPSLALTQLRSAVRASLPDVEIDIHNINLDCVPALGTKWYREISDGFQSWTGLGDWLFRGLAFPDADDNADEYLDWLSSQPMAPSDLRSLVLESRSKITEALVRAVRSRGIASYDVVGVSSMFSQHLAALAIVGEVKDQRADTLTIMGGANCESPMGDALLEIFPALDVVFSGRATVSFCEFLAHYGEQEKLADVPAIGGVVRRSSLSIARRSAPLNLDVPRVPELDYDDFVAELQAAPFEARLVLSFETSTGCWWGERSHCTFCGLNSTSMAYRALPPDDAVELVNSLLSRYSDVCDTFEAVDNILSHDYLKSVLPRLRAPEHVSLFYEVKANLAEKHVEALARARITRTQPGVEALSTEALRLLRKGTTGPRNVAFLRHCRAHGVWPDWNLLVSIPGESTAIYDLYLREFPKLVHLDPPAGAFDIRYDRFSPYFDDPERFGLTIEPYPFYSFLYPFGDSWLRRVAYFFADQQGHQARQLKLGDRPRALRELLARWQARWQGGSPPILELRDTKRGPTVVDTRDERGTVEHVLSKAELQLLELFDRGCRPQTAIERMGERGFTDRAHEATLGALRERGWLFEEGQRAISIVVDRRERRSTRHVEFAVASMV